MSLSDCKNYCKALFSIWEQLLSDLDNVLDANEIDTLEPSHMICHMLKQAVYLNHNEKKHLFC